MKNIFKVIGVFIGVLVLACIAGTAMTVIGIELGLERDQFLWLKISGVQIRS